MSAITRQALMPLGKVVSLEDVLIDKTYSLGIELFYQLELDLEKRRKNLDAGTTLLMGSSAGVFLGGFVYGVAAHTKNGLYVMLVGIIAGIGSMGVIGVLEKTYERKARMYLGGCKAIKSLHQSYVDFETNPRKEAIKQLVEKFDRVSNGEWLSDSLANGLISKEEGLLFQDMGKFLFINQLVVLIQKHQPKCDFVLNWKLESEAISNPNAKYPVTDLWDLFEIAPPLRPVCIAQSPEWMFTRSVPMKMIEIFSHILKAGIESKLI